MGAIRFPVAVRSRNAERVVRSLLGAAGLSVLVGCSVVQSHNPALRDTDAVGIPDLTGRWSAHDSAVVEVYRATGQPTRYVARVGYFDEDANAGIPPGAAVRCRSCQQRRSRDRTAVVTRDTVVSWYDVRLGRLGGRIVAEVTPSIDGDSALQRIIRRYSSQVAVSYILLVLDTHPDRLRVQFLRADAVQAILERGLCMSPRVTDTDRYSTDILFTGTSDETRHTYDCLLRRAGVLDSQAVELQRVRQP